ncbi:hypothetical protein SCUCBS95973_007514 [Sporothrix curviconia]|uniref:Karyogamy protein n=1 Tax=Sporothrix curviconia TaxID=1260050 RepID=A0ABP0CDW7_9PEZI
MPIQPPSSIPAQQPPPPPTTTTTTATSGLGLSRTRSLRRPQAGLSASAATAAIASATGAGTRAAAPSMTSSRPAASSGIPTRGASPSRLPTKPGLSSTGTAASTTGVVRPRPPSATGGLSSARLRRPDDGASTTTRPFTKPPSSSRSHLISSSAAASTAGAATQRRPTSSGGLPSSQAPASSFAAPFGQLSRTRPAASTTSGPVRGHTRTKSASVVSGSASSSAAAVAAKAPPRPPSRQNSRPPSATTLSSATVLRPPSAQSTSTGSSGTTSRPPTRGAASSTAATTATATATKTSTATAHRRPGTGASGTGAGAGTGAAVHHRPAFSTLQQHFSPAKNTAPKPRIATILAPPASPSKKPANIALSAETSRLQTTLLQLHLLHRDAAAVTAEWHASARQALAGERFAALVAEHAELAQMASKRAESMNAAALQAWAEDGSFDLTLEEKIQALDAVLAGIWSLAAAGQDPVHGQDKNTNKNKGNAPTSRYVQVVRRFERWAQQTADLVAARRGIDTLEDLLEEDEHRRRQRRRDSKAVAVEFLSNEKEPLLDAVWHEECGNLTHRLEGWQQQLARLGRGTSAAFKVNTRLDEDKDKDPQQQSSLHRILAGCSNLVDGMLEELRMMQQLEQDAAEQELAWIRKMNETIGLDMDSGSSNLSLQSHVVQQPARAGAVWRVM